MKNYITETITEERKRHANTTCNKCSKVVEFTQEDKYIWSNHSHSICLEFQEGSRYEFEKWCFDLCEDCAISLVRSLNIKPDWFDYGRYPLAVFEEFKETAIINYTAGYSNKELEEDERQQEESKANFEKSIKFYNGLINPKKR